MVEVHDNLLEDRGVALILSLGHGHLRVHAVGLVESVEHPLLSIYR